MEQRQARDDGKLDKGECVEKHYVEALKEVNCSLKVRDRMET